MAPSATQRRYPKRKRAAVNYEIDQSIDGDLDLEDDGNISEELGEDDSAATEPDAPAGAVNPEPVEMVAVIEVDSEYEDQTYGSRKIKKVCLPRSSFWLLQLTDSCCTAQSRLQAKGQVSTQGPASSRVEALPTHVSLLLASVKFIGIPNIFLICLRSRTRRLDGAFSEFR